MIELASPFNCTGCASCVNICPKNAISMKEDNEGFLFPEIDRNICIQCRKCEVHCPILFGDRPSMNYLEPTTFALWSEIDRTLSSSGGAFSAFARYCFQNNGIPDIHGEVSACDVDDGGLWVYTRTIIVVIT